MHVQKEHLSKAVITEHQENISFYVLGPDLDARGLDNSNLTNNIEIIDYKGFVKLVADNENSKIGFKRRNKMAIEVNGKSFRNRRRGLTWKR